MNRRLSELVKVYDDALPVDVCDRITRVFDQSATMATHRMIMFPPYWMYEHEALPPVSGYKYIISTYFLFCS